MLPLEEQRRIVDLLSRAAGIRRLAEAAQAKARDLIPALFVSMFGDPATNLKGWPVVPLSKLGTLDRGRSRHRPRNDPALYDGPYPFIQTGDVAQGATTLKEWCQTYSQAGLEQSRLWPPGTLCITIAANIADTTVLGFSSCFPDSVVGFTPSEGVSVRYVQVFLSFLKPYLGKTAPQLAQKNINLKILRGIQVPMPPQDLQAEFERQFAQVEGWQESWRQSTAHASLLSQSLMAQVFAA